MVATHFAFDALIELRDKAGSDIKDWGAAQKIIEHLIRTSIAHARNQVAGRRTETMTFDEAMQLAHNAMVTRPSWNIFCAVRPEEDGSLGYRQLDNCDGGPSGNGWPYKPTDEDRNATDWMFYQAPQVNWVELKFPRD